jgi:hydroxyacylglutathione hydrolase
LNFMKIYSFTIGDFAVNNYLVHDENSLQAVLIDAGYDPEPILHKIDELHLDLKYLVNTHGHGDHIAGNRKVIEHTGAQMLIHEKDVPYLTNSHLNLSAYVGIQVDSPLPDRLLREGDIIELDELKLKILHTPGHTPGHISLVGDDCMFVGDVIFQGSIGRTDFPGSSSRDLIHSIRSKIYALPDNTILYPGHGPLTRVGEEKVSNPFVSM